MPWKALLGLGSGIINGIMTNHYNEQNASRNQNYWEKQLALTYNANEQAANNAMKRSLDLYNQTQSPEAMVKQLKAAGLNPALMYSNGGMGGHTTNGPEGGVSGANGAPNPLGLQNFIDPLTMAQISNIDADTKKKNAETKKTEYEIETEKWNASLKEWESKVTQQNYEFNEETWSARYEQVYNEAKRLNGLAQQELTKGIIDQETFDLEVSRRIQEVANMKTMGELLKANKNLSEAQRKEVLAHIDEINSAIEVNGSIIKLNNAKAEDIINRFNAEYGWNFNKQDLFNSIELGIGAINTLIKALETFLPQQQIVEILKTFTSNSTKTTTTTTTKKG